MSELMMSATITGLTVEQFWALPEPPIGERHQLIDGEVHVAASPNLGHQQTVGALWRAMDGALAGTAHVAFFAPLDVVLGPRTVVQPDVLVYARDDVEAADRGGLVSAFPLLVVEVLSPSSSKTDLWAKRHRYERAGIPEYWVVDWQEQEIDVVRLVDGRYEEAGTFGPGDVLTTPTLPDVELPVTNVLEV